MSWNGFVSSPNWTGEDQAQAQAAVGDLYILPDPPTIAENPSIGLEGRNEVPLPTKYLDLEVANLTATDIQADDITTENLTATDITATNINGNPDFDASNWSLFLAINDVRGTLGVFSVPLYSISDFLNLTVANNITAQGGNIAAGLTVSAGVSVTSLLGSFTSVTAESVQVSLTNETAAVDIYGASLLAGNNALYVEGGTTLTGGGVIHGVTIGALQVAGIDTVRIDVLPAGMDLTSATFISINAAGAANLVAGGALALAGGSYISYNSDQHYFTNTTSGNDFTDIYVGNIHAADGGSAPLRINDSGRGVELANVKSVDLFTETFPAWSGSTPYAIDDKVELSAVGYKALFANRNTAPNVAIPNWVGGGTNYEQYEIVFSAGFVYQALTQISSSITAPASDPDWLNMGFTTNAITNIWTTESPFVSTITGDTFSTITIGAIVAPVDFVRVDGDGFLAGNTTAGLDRFNYIDLVAQDGNDATLSFSDSAYALQSRIAIDNTAKRLTIQSDTGLTINSTGVTTTDFSAGVVEDLKTLNLTTTLFPLWNVATSYANDAEVSYQDGNWRSQFAGNLGNIPLATLENWVSGEAYAVGNVRYYATNNKAYLCNTAVTLGTTTPPPSDAKWTEFQVGNNGEDVWYAFTAPVVSTIVGDKLSEITIGNQSFVNANGEYLSIRNAVAGDPLDADQNALISSAGTLGLAGATAVSVVAVAGTATIASFGDVDITGDTGVTIGSDNGNIELNAPAGTIDITSDLTTSITSANAITLSSQEATTITSTANIITITGSTGVSLTSPEAITLTSSTTDVTITSTLGDVDITAGNNVTINAGAAAVNLSSSTETVITSGDYMTIQADEAIDVISNINAISILGATGVEITATANDVNIISSAGVGITTAVGGNVEINTYYPPLTIYKNATIGSAVSRAANTAEVQVYPQEMTLKANTQYLLNMSYAGLTENVSTATPNNNYYLIYRIHQGTTPLTTSNLWGLAQQFNSTAQAGGVSVSFMTTTAGTYTGRFYIRNQNATVALTIANLSATVTEVF